MLHLKMKFFNAYLAAALWSSTDDNDDPLDKNYGEENVDPSTLASMYDDCSKFYDENEAMIGERASDAGHDFWLTRNSHGAGFWDGHWAEHGDALTEAAKKYKECYLYVGDDGMLYI